MIGGLSEEKRQGFKEQFERSIILKTLRSPRRTRRD